MKEKSIKQIKISYIASTDKGTNIENEYVMLVDMNRGELINSWDKWMWKILEQFREAFFRDKDRKLMEDDDGITIKNELIK